MAPNNPKMGESLKGTIKQRAGSLKDRLGRPRVKFLLGLLFIVVIAVLFWSWYKRRGPAIPVPDVPDLEPVTPPEDSSQSFYLEAKSSEGTNSIGYNLTRPRYVRLITASMRARGGKGWIDVLPEDSDDWVNINSFCLPGWGEGAGSKTIEATPNRVIRAIRFRGKAQQIWTGCGMINPFNNGKIIWISGEWY